MLSGCDPNWTVTPEREEMLEELPGCIATTCSVLSVLRSFLQCRAEKADAKFNILKNLELLRVVGANDRMSVIQLVQVGVMLIYFCTGVLPHVAAGTAKYVIRDRAHVVGDGMGTGLANIQFRDAQGRQCAHVAIMCIGEEASQPRLALKDYSLEVPKGPRALAIQQINELELRWVEQCGLFVEADCPQRMVKMLDFTALAAFRGLDPPAVSTPELLEAIAQCELMLDTASSAHRAVEAARNAVALAPGATLTLPEAKQTLARALMSAFRVPEAIEMYQQVLTLLPGDPEASAELSEASAALKAHERRLATLPGTEEDWAARRRRLLAALRAQRRPNWKEADWQVHAFARLDLGAIYGRCMNNIARVDVHDEKYKNFGREYQSRSVPAVINGAMHRWPAMSRWSMENFAADFGHQKIICDHRFGIRMRFNDFRDYMAEQEDDTPLYLFDHAFGEYPSTKTLLGDYEVPEAFRSDLLAELGPLRPPFRWLLLGPRRSGSTLHKDPLGTSAWNALVFGKKLWVLFPPSTPPELLRPEADADFSEESASCWFLHWWKSARARAWPEQFRPIEFLQQPGEVVFVPARWWHAVLNLEDSLAVTQNFCNEWNVGNVWRCTSATHPVLARHLRQSLKCQRPDLCEALMAKQSQMEGDDPKVSYVFDSSSRRVALDKQEEPMSSDDEYLTWMANSPFKRRRYSGEEDPKRPKKSHAEQVGSAQAARNELPFGSSELEKVLTELRAWECFDRRASFPAMDAETLVTLARVAERAERYDEMANYMKMRVQMGSILNPEERDMFSAAFKNSLTERRVAVRVADGVEQMETLEGRDAHASLARGYRSKVEAELQSICEDALALLRSNLVPNAEAGEAKTFYLKMHHARDAAGFGSVVRV
ncbi:jmjd6-b [Symbiodinium sp. CCMP2592]|nr:jmjd6-b [Symbiodinium sp. CCMP2592]